MKKHSLVRNLLMSALLVGGIFAVGAGNDIHAQDGTGQVGSGGGTGQMGSGGRSGYLISGGRAESSTTSSTTDSTRSGYIGAGHRAESTILTEPAEESFFQTILNFFF